VAKIDLKKEFKQLYSPSSKQVELVTIPPLNFIVIEGEAAQILYVGPFVEEGPSIDRIHAFLREKGLVFDGIKQKHHEIYLSDFRKTDPARLKTIIRQPARKPAG
jgi:hypothetical protein